MRFKPRTDLERVYDEVNKLNMGRISKFVIEKQLRELDLNTIKRTNTNAVECLDFKNHLAMADKMKNVKMNTLENELDKAEKNSKSTMEDKKKKMNQDSKNMISELHEKTHFKGASEIANNCGNNSFLYLASKIKKRKNSLNKKSSFSDEDDIFRVTEEKITETDEMSYKRGFYSKNYNPYKSSKKIETISPNNLQVLKQIAFNLSPPEKSEKKSGLENKHYFKYLTKLIKKKNSLSILKNNPMHFFKHVVPKDYNFDDPKKSMFYFNN